MIRVLIFLYIFRYIDDNQWSKKQADLFIATQSALLQMDEKSAHTPIELNRKIRELLRCNPDLAEAVRYFNYYHKIGFLLSNINNFYIKYFFYEKPDK